MQSGAKEQFKEYLTIAEAAEMLGISPATLRNWDKSGKLKPTRHPVNGYRIYRHEDLRSVHPTLSDWAHIGDNEHFVQFYESDDGLARSVGSFIAESLEAGHAGLIVATKAHRSAIEEYLQKRGLNIEALRKRGQFVSEDAANMLARFMNDQGEPDLARFNDSVGATVAKLSAAHGKLRAFGEMVALLWADGKHDAAIQLEDYWNELGQHHHFALFCGYPLDQFNGADQSEMFGRVCAHHTQVIPGESYQQLHDDKERRNEVAMMQQKIAAYEAELQHRRRVESSLKDREDQLKMVLDHAPIYLARCDLNGRFQFVNRTYAERFGKRPEAFIGRSIEEALGKQAFSAVEPYMRQVLSGERTEFEIVVPYAEMGDRVMHCIYAPEFGPSRKVEGWISVATDVTERKRAEKDLSLLATVVESSQDAIMTKSADGTVLSWNRGAEKLFGYTPDEIVGRSVTFIIPSEWHEEERLILERLRRGERIEHYETQRLTKDGRRVDLSLTLSPLYDNFGRIIGASSVARDIGEQKRIRKQLQEALEHAQAASIAKTEFLANMSHELRTPLNAVIGLADLLHATDRPWAQQREFIRTLHLSAQQLLQLINDLLDISKLEIQKVELERIPFDLSEVVAEAVNMHAVQAQEKGISLHAVPPQLESMSVLGDPLRLRQVLANLLSNAIKFTEKGNVTLKTTFVEQPGSGLFTARFDVIDSGIGIAPEHFETIFSKFTQGDSSITRKYGGTGLGLAITKTLVELMGGTVALTSELGKGSHFTVSLPFLKAHDHVAAASAPEAVAKTPIHARVLLVEDYPANILVTSTMLKSMGCSFEVANTGKQALDRLKNESFDCILMDVQMPEMDGFQATQYLRIWEKEEGRPHTPVIGMTAHALKGDRERCLESGMDDYLSKPFLQEELEDKLESFSA